jgi:dTDP-4-dehydrorhamnose 3,5-epimerase
VLSETADFLYKCSDYYDAGDDCGVLWNDPALAIDWDTPLPILSAKDERHLPLAQVPRERLPVFQP